MERVKWLYESALGIVQLRISLEWNKKITHKTEQEQEKRETLLRAVLSPLNESGASS